MPLGWHISVYRQQNDGASPAAFGDVQGPRLAVWQTALGGLYWLDELVRQANAVDLGGNGYPKEYTAQAIHLLPSLRNGPPLAKAVWTSGSCDILTSQWAGQTVTDEEVIDACRPDEWLMVQAWDES